MAAPKRRAICIVLYGREREEDYGRGRKRKECSFDAQRERSSWDAVRGDRGLDQEEGVEDVEGAVRLTADEHRELGSGRPIRHRREGNRHSGSGHIKRALLCGRR